MDIVIDQICVAISIIRCILGKCGRAPVSFMQHKEFYFGITVYLILRNDAIDDTVKVRFSDEITYEGREAVLSSITMQNNHTLYSSKPVSSYWM